ncbi:hypothetical protein CKN99_05950 [Carnobacterium maltaromaticum]|uniref:ImmA/IrrE family metallo-endopeptidase n=1 Tax=Carnobacterium maltaromaticum TaxID=2751 RepID=UPI001071C3BA|nr:ImmA/IrrE family metallo-endopeptidase [Carnobacterium maltaromaticum]MDT1946050.1 ImmA/IrrE family metallo-endopeptidase [Carnobacterium maltaromaticum]MDT2000554.1 ImmA/IrrE family metallo-endopeptidase [Carnobacterium maltaromaticum]TFJ28853.1 hypothetical protein CKN90_05905 [Carnobacterium maltaromaticum]TFJ32551.1 hypothetical protein CKN98_05915 [Carnobacterium maltaromaticum]TFJ36579.1 hypothetical protein CKN88_05975 [Carnobacterium maltaromaticum]
MNNKIKNLVNLLSIQHQSLDPFVLAKKLHIVVKYVQFDDAPLGDSAYILGRNYIFIDQRLEFLSERYTICAHELFHALQHTNLKDFYFSNTIAKSYMEIEADRFSEHLLNRLNNENPSISYKENLSYSFLNNQQNYYSAFL